MYLSCLLADLGTNPDRPRPGRKWLRNAYRVHQRLCMAFPDAARKGSDPLFLKPYDPDAFARGHVHVVRTERDGFLFRIDPTHSSRAAILVQSASKPDWSYAFHNAPGLLAALPETRKLDAVLRSGQRLRFRLQANPTKKIETTTKEERLAGAPKRNGRRVPVPSNGSQLRDWLETRADRCGFDLADHLTIETGYVYVNKTHEATGGHRLRSVVYEGVLRITDMDRFASAMACGIGPAKGFGFGLLSTAPVGSASR